MRNILNLAGVGFFVVVVGWLANMHAHHFMPEYFFFEFSNQPTTTKKLKNFGVSRRIAIWWSLNACVYARLYNSFLPSFISWCDYIFSLQSMPCLRCIYLLATIPTSIARTHARIFMILLGLYSPHY